MAVLLPCGVHACRRSIASHPELLPLASVPLAFGVQQGLEGLIWLRQDAAAGNRGLATLYLVFALVVWLIGPSLVARPLCRSGWKRRLCLLSAVLGACLGGGLLLSLTTDPGWRGAAVVQGSIDYGLRTRLLAGGPGSGTLWHGLQLLYAALALGPLWLAEAADLRPLATALALAAVVSELAYSHAFPSVWCFFAAALSAGIVVIVRSCPPHP